MNNVDLAEQLWETQTLGGNIDSRYKHQVNMILKNCTPPGDNYPERQQVMLKIIELIGEPSTPKERYFVAMAYAWSRATYRKEAIHYIELYLNNELYDIYKHVKHSIYFRSTTLEQERNIHIGDMYKYLGKAYEGEYEFEKALECYKRSNQLMNFWAFTYIDVSRIYTKMNQLDNALTFLENAKNNYYYKNTTLIDNYSRKFVTTEFRDVINSEIKNVKDKIQRGYTYRPRKRIEKIFDSQNKYCIYCGKQISQDSKFCTYCGKKQEL